MRKRLTSCALGLVALVLSFPAAAEERPGATDVQAREVIGEGGVECLCHIPPGHPESAQTICVGGRAPQAHLRHGDTLGDCDETQREMVCDDGQDNDQDNFIDCQDPDCIGEPAPDPLGMRGFMSGYSLDSRGTSLSGSGGLGSRRSVAIEADGIIGLCEQAESSCGDGFDNDGDGTLDCGDVDCMASEDCDGPGEEICNDGLENDRDGLTDCADPDCVGEEGPFDVICQQPESNCSDGFDNDGDLDIDCLDEDCMAAPACDGPGDEACDDGLDNDDDELIDCADPECVGELGESGEVCQQPEANCADGFDNDADRSIDCLDTDCADSEACRPTDGEICNDGMDNDDDLDIDCADEGCAGRTGPDGETCEQPEVSCQDTFDNDGDGFTDCADLDCASLPVCDPFREICDDENDNDLDDLVDCDDPDCAESAACVS